jgi:hypothetical protein
MPRLIKGAECTFLVDKININSLRLWKKCEEIGCGNRILTAKGC